MDELWRSLNSAGISQRMGWGDKAQFSQWISSTPRGAEMLGGEIQKNVLNPDTKGQIGQNYANYISGKILSEEMAAARNNALTQGREPTVAEMRAARQRANDKITSGGYFAPGLGMPSSFQVGSRGPLGRPRLKIEAPQIEPVTDQKKRDLAAGLFQREMNNARNESVRRYRAGEAPSPEPTAADLRIVINTVNEQLKEMGIGEGVQFLVGSRGPVGVPKLVHKTETEEEYYERKNAKEKKENLNLSPVLDVKDGNVPIPSQDITPQNVVTKSIQAALPRPPVHEFCRCVAYDVGGNIIFKTADDTACAQCKMIEQQYQGAPKEAEQMVLGEDVAG